MNTTRRDFIKAATVSAVVSATSGTAAANALTPAEEVQWYKSVCRFCGTGRGVMLGMKGGIGTNNDEIKAIFICMTNPGQSLPNITPYWDAMGKPRAGKPFIVVIDGYPTGTTEPADPMLPAAIWTEMADVFGMSERRYQYQPKLRTPPGEARSDFDVLLDLGTRLETRGVIREGYVSSRFKNTDDAWDEMREASKNTAYDFIGMAPERPRKKRGIRWPALDEKHPLHGAALRQGGESRRGAARRGSRSRRRMCPGPG